MEKEPSPLRIGLSSASVCVAHQGWGSSDGIQAMVQPVQVTPSKIKGKLHSGPDMVLQVGLGSDVVVGSAGPETNQANHK